MGMYRKKFYGGGVPAPPPPPNRNPPLLATVPKLSAAYNWRAEKQSGLTHEKPIST